MIIYLLLYQAKLFLPHPQIKLDLWTFPPAEACWTWVLRRHPLPVGRKRIPCLSPPQVPTLSGSVTSPRICFVSINQQRPIDRYVPPLARLPSSFFFCCNLPIMFSRIGFGLLFILWEEFWLEYPDVLVSCSSFCRSPPHELLLALALETRLQDLCRV